MKYGMPYGRLYLVYCDERLAGCIGLRKIDNENCEMKRLYTRPEFRGKKLGNILVEKIIEDAKKTGYSYMLLDTLPFLQSAIHIYKKFGFYEIESYIESNRLSRRKELRWRKTGTEMSGAGVKYVLGSYDALGTTAVNQQKFLFELKNGQASAKALNGFYTKIDLGIVQYRFEAVTGYTVR